MHPKPTSPEPSLTHYECGHCQARITPDGETHLCRDCIAPLLARYDLAAVAERWQGNWPAGRGMWRWGELLPVAARDRIELGAGDTPLLPTAIGDWLGTGQTWIKDETHNPTASFKARGMAVAVSRAVGLGAECLVVPSAGNAAAAAAAYCAAAGKALHVFMPADVPETYQTEVRAHAARLSLVDGLIDDCGKRAGAGEARYGWFNLATFREPGRVEGKKTLGYEVAEALAGELPEVIIYPTGGGTGIVAMWKAFDELEALGLIGAKRPRLVMVQASNCAPLAEAFDTGEDWAGTWQGAETIADGMRVPKSFGDRLVLSALRASEGEAVRVADEEMIEYARVMAANAGLLPSPEGAACLAAQARLAAVGRIGADERVVLFNTGSALKSPHLWPQRTDAIEARTPEPETG